MTKLDRAEFTKTVTMLLSAHIAAHRNSDLVDISDSVIDDACNLTGKIFEKTRKLPKKYKKSVDLVVVHDKTGTD